MGRYRKDLPPAVTALADRVREEVWHQALSLMRQEIRHNRTCTDPDCGGVIYPWLVENLADREGAIAFAAVVMEKSADGVGGLLAGEQLPEDPGAPPAGTALGDALAAFEAAMDAARRRHDARQGGDHGSA